MAATCCGGNIGIKLRMRVGRFVRHVSGRFPLWVNMLKAGSMRMLKSGKMGRIAALLACAGVGLATIAGPADAYLYWERPTAPGAPAVGGEAGITLPLPGAKPDELAAALTWTMRAGLNVAALQCQFAPALRTLDNYNNMLQQHAAELRAAVATLNAYFKRTAGKNAALAFDDFNTKTYNGFSTLRAQLSFCEVASSIGEETMEQPRGRLAAIAAERMREFRSSLTPVGDRGLVMREVQMQFDPIADPRCYNKRGKEIRCKEK